MVMDGLMADGDMVAWGMELDMALDMGWLLIIIMIDEIEIIGMTRKMHTAEVEKMNDA